MKVLKTKPIPHDQSYVEVRTTGPMLDFYHKFRTQEEQFFAVFVEDDEKSIKTFGLLFLGQQGREEFEITDSLDDNFKFFKTIIMEGDGESVYVFIREFEEEVTQ